MPRFITTILQAWAERRRARRRQANLRAGARTRPSMRLVPTARAGRQSAASGATSRAADGARELGRQRAMWIAVVGVCVVAGGGALIGRASCRERV